MKNKLFPLLMLLILLLTLCACAPNSAEAPTPEASPAPSIDYPFDLRGETAEFTVYRDRWEYQDSLPAAKGSARIPVLVTADKDMYDPRLTAHMTDLVETAGALQATYTEPACRITMLLPETEPWDFDWAAGDSQEAVQRLWSQGKERFPDAEEFTVAACFCPGAADSAVRFLKTTQTFQGESFTLYYVVYGAWTLAGDYNLRYDGSLSAPVFLLQCPTAVAEQLGDEYLTSRLLCWRTENSCGTVTVPPEG